MVKGIVKCSSNCSNPDNDIFTLGPGTWNISEQNRMLSPDDLEINGYYIISPIMGAADISVGPLDGQFASVVSYRTVGGAAPYPSPTIIKYNGMTVGGVPGPYEFTDSKGFNFATGFPDQNSDDYFVRISTTSHLITSS